MARSVGGYPLGPTGLGASGRSGDRGSLYSAFAIIPNARQCVMDFGTMLEWVSLPPDRARDLAAQFRKRISAEYGQLLYDARTLPIVVSADGDQVRVKLPAPAEVLIANPEVFLALADRLDEVAATMEGSATREV